MSPGSQPRREPNPCCAVLHTQSVDDYLKALYELTVGGVGATTSSLAQRLQVEPPSVSAMLRRLAADDLITRPGPHQVLLTPHGTRHAVAMVRRHRLIEEFLFRVLAMPWEDLHAEAEVLEHSVSDRLLERIDGFLGHPSHDPHGDPIPPAQGDHTESWAMPLAQAQIGSTFRVERVRDRDRDALRHLGGIGIRPGTVVTVVEQAPFGGPLWVEVDGRRHALGPALAEIVHGAPA